MLREFIYLHWKAARAAVFLLVPLAFGLPVLVVRTAQRAAHSHTIFDSFSAGAMLGVVQIWTPLFPLLAAISGVVFALTAWNWDHRGNHIYALSLPLPRWEYAFLKMVAGLILLAAPILAIYAGALVGRLTTEVPNGLTVYVASFGSRFMLAALLAYAMTFALAAGTVGTTIRVMGALIALVIFGSLITDFLQSAFGLNESFSVLHLLETALLDWPGPFHVFGGNWMLIDV